MKSLARFLCLFALTTGAVSADVGTIHVTSPAFKAGGNMPDRFTCKGARSSPPLEMSGVPAGAKSLAVIIDDPDAPQGLFTHWLVWNIDPAIAAIGENVVPMGAVQGTNDFGKFGYGAPCPPRGTHRYFFRVLALDCALDLQRTAKRPAFDQAIAGHILARGEFFARCSR